VPRTRTRHCGRQDWWCSAGGFQCRQRVRGGGIPGGQDSICRHHSRNRFRARQAGRHACADPRAAASRGCGGETPRSGDVQVLSWVAPIIVFGLVVFVHELGHFIAAKLTGVYAPRFSIGFGPSLLKKRFGETEYVLAALPLGGYVRMASREDEATAFLEGGSENSAVTPGNPKYGYDPNAMIPFGPKPIPESRWFESKSLPARLFIMLAGVTINALLAYGIYAGLLLHSGMPTPIPVAAAVTPGKPAAIA